MNPSRGLGDVYKRQVLFKLFLDKWDGSTQVVPGLPGSEGGSPPVIAVSYTHLTLPTTSAV